MNLRELSKRFAADGRLEAILLRSSRRGPVVSATEASAEVGRGLLGDHRASVLRTDEQVRKRELTLFQFEHLDTVARWCGIPSVDPSRLRRNLVISGINLASMRSPFPDLRIEWAVGDVVRIEVTGTCDPCSRMEQELGLGGYNSLRGHGGMTARIVVSGDLRVGDPVRLSAVHQLS